MDITLAPAPANPDCPVTDDTATGSLLRRGHAGMLSGMTTPAAELHPCACGCGQPVTGRWARGHHRRGPANPQPPLLPGPDDDLDIGIIDLEEPPEPDSPPPPPPPEGPEDDDIRPLGYPAGPRSKGTGKPRTASPVRITAALRKDIAAKVQLMLYVPGKVWETRDPYCGGMFVHQGPAIGDALTDIICQSPDLIAFFTGPAGGFMIYLNLLTSLQPVALTIWQHHIAHAIGSPAEDGQGPPRPDMAQYAA
jgi:hypothetical protein